jgi:hypothetical protein
MALELSKDFKDLTLNYHHVRLCNINQHKSKAYIAVHSFVDEAARTDSIQNDHKAFRYTVTDEDFDTYFADSNLEPEGITPVTQAYEYLKAEHTDEWGDATDV